MMKDLVETEFDSYQMEQIRLGLEKGLDINWYAKPEFNHYQMQEIRLGLEKGVDVSWYAEPEFSWEQMRVIRYGLIKKLDVSWYARPEFNWKQMKKMRVILKQGKIPRICRQLKVLEEMQKNILVEREKEKGEDKSRKVVGQKKRISL